MVEQMLKHAVAMVVLAHAWTAVVAGREDERTQIDEN